MLYVQTLMKVQLDRFVSLTEHQLQSCVRARVCGALKLLKYCMSSILDMSSSRKRPTSPISA